jgi:3-methyladenine DNA glycosylase AlkD
MIDRVHQEASQRKITPALLAVEVHQILKSGVQKGLGWLLRETAKASPAHRVRNPAFGDAKKCVGKAPSETFPNPNRSRPICDR